MLPLSVYRHVQLNGEFGREEGVLNGDEQFIMNLIVNGATYEQIAEQINTSKRTVENYLRKIYEKLGVRSKVEALEKYIKSPYYSSCQRRE
ncbi:response regulator transcription factor [Paenibacillus sp. SYP-B4298]|uniref:response regulator transcription factor n=1 Tax=Paenibacillus sp. SYP-B4298 TaxID=2996034 RepID=UPI0022DE0C80|nr:helix-turn-helix transcriptional regulator [Paenibacillus sp. SYP-B4298]